MIEQKNNLKEYANDVAVKVKQSFKDSVPVIKKYGAIVWTKVKSVSLNEVMQSTLDFLYKIKEYPYKSSVRNVYGKIKKIKLKKTAPVKYVRKIGRKLSSSWKVILTIVPMFLFFYYAIGSLIVEDIDITTEYDLPAENSPLFETPDGMAFLLKREIDDKMWTPNLPMIFPAYVLDNMPNFQEGIVDAVRDVSGIMRKLSFNTPSQIKDIKEAYKLLNYPPNVWIMTRKNALKLAPSSNSQYRKAAKKLKDYRRNGLFTKNPADLEKLITGIGKKLQKISQANEEYQQEKSGDFIDTQADDLFYRHRGYAFALWQMVKALGTDYKDLILNMNVYPEWTYLASSLKRAAEMQPRFVRNGCPTSLFVPNHLIMQNYYLLRALTAAEKIRNSLIREEYVNQN